MTLWTEGLEILMSIRNGKAYRSMVTVKQNAFGLDCTRFVIQASTKVRYCLQVATGVHYPSNNQWVIYFKKPWTRDHYRLFFTSQKEMEDFVWYVLNTKRNFWKRSVATQMEEGKLNK
jgi:hypothetical protein